MNSKKIWESTATNTKKQREDNKISILKRSFENNINFETVYKNFDPENTFRTWIYDFNSEKADSEKKYIHMYPFEEIRQGEYIHWKDAEDIWIVRGIETQYDYVNKGMMYKCIKTRLTWVDEFGLHKMPMYSESKVLRDPLLDNGKIFLVDDSMEAYVQKNETTLALKENYRFAFGRNTIFKLIEIVDYYIDNTIKLLLKKDENLEKDDFVNGLGFIKDYKYQILPFIPEGIQGSIGSTYQLTYDYVYNEKAVSTPNVDWSSSDTSIATVDNSGLVTFIANGTVDISADYNGLIATVEVKCVNTPVNYTYTFSPDNRDSVDIGEDTTFTVLKLVDGVTSSFNSTVTCDSTDESFEFESLGLGSFRIQNKTEANRDIVVTLTDLDNLEVIEKTYKLRMW